MTKFRKDIFNSERLWSDGKLIIFCVCETVVICDFVLVLFFKFFFFIIQNKQNKQHDDGENGKWNNTVHFGDSMFFFTNVESILYGTNYYFFLTETTIWTIIHQILKCTSDTIFLLFLPLHFISFLENINLFFLFFTINFQ